MKPLALKVMPALLSVPGILDQLGYFSGTLIPSVLRLYESLTGRAMDVSSSRGRSVSVLMGEIDKVTVPRIKKLLPDNNGHGRDCDSVTVSVRHHFGDRGWYLVVELRIEFYLHDGARLSRWIEEEKENRLSHRSRSSGPGAQVREGPGNDAR